VRAGVLHVARFCGRTTERRASPFGSVVTGSLGLPSGLPFAIGWRAGFPDMSRSSSLLAERQGKLYLPDKEFRYLRTVHCCYSSADAEWLTHFWPALTVAREIGLSHLLTDE
jgi:hypothetical protein